MKEKKVLQLYKSKEKLVLLLRKQLEWLKISGDIDDEAFDENIDGLLKILEQETQIKSQDLKQYLTSISDQIKFLRGLKVFVLEKYDDEKKGHFKRLEKLISELDYLFLK